MKSDLAKALEKLANGPLIDAFKPARTDHHGFTQGAIADALGMSQEAYAAMRWYERRPSPRPSKRRR